eukprot:TRINITY_DN2101_c0_g1_i3.p2 TRINITY_DN2101_c0_g1~~TRINITY_DN2101_c0_g1_i3.p2  ORF type:complete len:129 (-),score=25.33 TRINITY_DN2101_c0_g1_i3:496-882(-)
MVLFIIFFFFNDTATTEIYTLHIVGSVRCVQETGTWGLKRIGPGEDVFIQIATTIQITGNNVHRNKKENVISNPLFISWFKGYCSGSSRKDRTGMFPNTSNSICFFTYLLNSGTIQKRIILFSQKLSV